MNCASRSQRVGFTLIELLVVVAIIALLISILLPSLSEAREQGKVAKCLANLRTIMIASTSYLIDEEERFPFGMKPGGSWLCSWAYGGKTTDDFWRTRYSGNMYYTAVQKPINYYVYGGNFEPDMMNGVVAQKRAELRMFQCPSDRAGNQRRFLPAPDKSAPAISSYDDVGTSYQFNIICFINTNKLNTQAVWEEQLKICVTDAQSGYGSRMMMFWEDNMDWAAGNFIQTIGNHGKFSQHSGAFLDGHAEHKYVDTRTSGGPGWCIINPNWIKSPTDTPQRWYVPVIGGWSQRNLNPPP